MQFEYDYTAHHEMSYSMPQLDFRTATPDLVKKYFDNTFKLDDTLFRSIVSDEALYTAPDRLRRPLIFYLGHTAAFFINKLAQGKFITPAERINPHFESLFAIGVDEMSWDDMDDSHFDWPTVQEVWEYRGKVYNKVMQFIDSISHIPMWPNTQQTPWWAVLMGIEHEHIHIETSSVLLRQLDAKYLVKPKSWRYATTNGRFVDNDMIEVPAQTVVLGKSESFPAYGWDNEYGKKVVQVSAFRASKYKVTNGEFLRFVQEGGYSNKKYWDEEGWAWVTYKNAKYPLFWVQEGSRFRYRTIFEVIEMPWDWPVDVNCHEANAFCRWKGNSVRILSEEEHWAIRGSSKTYFADPMGVDASSELNAGRDLAFLDKYPYNAALQYCSSSPVDQYPANELGFHDVFGNIWEWTTSFFDGLPGFKTHPLYDDFSTPCFDGKHNMIMGGSFISCGNESSIFARYAFRRHFYQHAGFRLAQTISADGAVVAEDDANKENPYESPKILREYVLFHYGTSEEQMPWPQGPKEGTQFPLRCAQLVMEMAQKYIGSDKPGAMQRALDIGCAVGRSTFELTRVFENVLGLDYSGQFIQAAQILKERGFVKFDMADEGVLSINSTAVVDPAIDRMRASFARGDACSLSPDLGEFDALLAANLIDRLYEPALFLNALKRLVRVGGVAVLTSPYTWMDEYTPRDKWVGGRLDDKGEKLRTIDGLAAMLAPEFELVETRDLPFIIREHGRKFQWSVAQGSVWVRRA